MATFGAALEGALSGFPEVDFRVALPVSALADSRESSLLGFTPADFPEVELRVPNDCRERL